MISGISTNFSEHPRIGIWWTGLDSNQRTLARADLQSAAFNHSATCPHQLAGDGLPRIVCLLRDAPAESVGDAAGQAEEIGDAFDGAARAVY